MRLSVIEQPTVEPVSVAELREQLSVQHTSQQTTMERCITAARRAAERDMRRTLIRTKLRWIPEAGEQTIYFPRPPIIEVESISHLAEEGEPLVALDNALFLPHPVSDEPATLVVTPAIWSTYFNLAGPEIIYYAGYGEEASDVPDDIRHAILMYAATLYENRSAVFTPDNNLSAPPQLLPMGWDMLLWPYRVPRLT